MPFYGYTGIPSPDAPNISVTGRVLKWLVKENDYVQPDTNIAEIAIGAERFHVVICFPALIEKQLTKEGQTSEKNTSLLKWNADGERIPYGSSYFITKKVNAEQSAVPLPRDSQPDRSEGAR
ncbi:MAG: hypothetical protein WCH86_01475 [Kiritimatiellales bacterium]